MIFTKSMSKFGTLISFSCILLLSLFFDGCKGSKAIDAAKQFNYSYNAESFGYSDIKRLYSSDTVNAKKSFFNSESLQHLEIIINSDIKKTILENNLSGVLFSYQLQNPSLVIKNGGISTNSDILINDLSKPVFVQTDSLGKVVTLRLDSGITEIATGIYKDIISRMQFAQPVKKMNTWQTTEENTMGTYIAEYTAKDPDSSGNRYSKKIVEYIKYKSKKENQKVKIDNETTIVTDAKGTIITLNTSEAQIILNNQDTLSILGAKTSVFLTSKESVQNKDIVPFWVLVKSPSYSQTTTLSKSIPKGKIRRMAYEGTLGLDNWQTLSQQLSRAKNLTKKEEESLILKFRGIFYLHPEYCKKAVSILTNESYNSNTFNILSQALSITETTHAIDALATLIDNNKSNEEILVKLLPVLATTEFPTKRAVEVLKTLAFTTNESQDYFITSTAQLALGGMANNFIISDTLQSNKLTYYLIEKMKFETDTIQQLLVLGNTGSYYVFPYVKSFVENKLVSQEVKLEAVSALTLINNKGVTNYIRELLKNEDEEIKNKAQEVLDFRNEYFK